MYTDTVNHPEKKLGRRPPSNAPSLKLSAILKAEAPAHPTAEDNLSHVSDFGMYDNNRFGVCGPTSVANSLKLITKVGTGTEVSVTQDAVFDLYRRSGNPNFDPKTGADDNGVDMQTMLDALLKDGIQLPDGSVKRPAAFASVDVSNLDEVKAGVAYFGCVLWGVDLETAQQSEQVWDYHNSGEWGGHAVCCGTYTGKGLNDFGVVSWAEILGASDAFCQHQLQEAWVVVWPEHLEHPGFLAGVDVNALATAYKEMTGRDMPTPSPTPGPTPTPVPTPGAAPFPDADPAVAKRIEALAERRDLTTSAYLNWLLSRLFHVAAGQIHDESDAAVARSIERMIG